MKRIILIITVMLVSIGLTGCDFITPEVIDQVTEDLCREDPTNALCDITDLTTVSEAVATQLVLDAIDLLNLEDGAVCDEVFSVTNPTLLDSCKDGSLLPEGVTSFTVLTYVQEGDIYIFQGSISETEFLEVQITIGEVDGEMRVTSFVTTSIEDPTKTDTCTEDCETELVTMEEFETMFKQFIIDYLDTTITAAVLEENYFYDELDTDFVENRIKDQEEGLLITYISAVMGEDNEFTVTLDMERDGETSREVLPVRVTKRVDKTTPLLRSIDTGIDNDCNDTDDCKLDDYLTGEEGISYLEQYFLDYVDKTISNEDFINQYFDGDAEDSFAAERTMDLEDNAVFTLLNVLFEEDGSYVAEYTRQAGEDIILRKRPGRIRKRPDLLLQEWDQLIDEQMSLTLNGATTFFGQFVVDYLNPDITDDSLAMTYFDEGTMLDFIANRQDDLTKGLQIVVNRLELTDVFGEFNVYITLDDGTTQRDEKIKVRVMKRIDKTTPLLMILDTGGEDNDCDYIGDMCEVVTDSGIAFGYMDYFMTQFNDPMVTMEALQMYVLDYFSMFNQREEDLNDGIVWVLDSKVEPLDNNYFMFHFSAETATGIIHRDIAARLYHRGSMVYIRESYVDFYEHDIEMIVPFLEHVFNALNDSTLSDDMLQEQYFGWMAPESLLSYRNNGQAGAVYVYQRVTAPVDVTVDPFFELVLTITLPDQDPITETLRVQFVKTDMGLMIEFWVVMK